MWDEIGVTVDIKIYDIVTIGRLEEKREHTGLVWDGMEVGNPIDSLIRCGQTDNNYNFAVWSNERFDELTTTMVSELDPDERSLQCKEAAQIMIHEMPYIGSATGVAALYYWPWLKNYYGERAVADFDIVPMLAVTWIDEDLKEEMGY